MGLGEGTEGAGEGGLVAGTALVAGIATVAAGEGIGERAGAAAGEGGRGDAVAVTLAAAGETEAARGRAGKSPDEEAEEADGVDA
jgi:hypothetical protein